MFWVHLLHWEHLNQDNMEIGRVTGLVVPFGPRMHGLLETPGLTFTGHLEHGLLSLAPYSAYTE
jgi:hypothetical protein